MPTVVFGFFKPGESAPVNLIVIWYLEVGMLRGATDAETCRLNGWTVGTVLVGDEGFGPETIVITGIGETGILARRIKDQRGNLIISVEGNWTLFYRDWREVAPIPL